MSDQKEYIDALIARYLAGEALPEEAMELEDWKADSADNLSYYLETSKAFELVYGLKQSDVDVQELFGKITGQIAQETEKTLTGSQIYESVKKRAEDKVINLSFTRFFTPMRVAATLIILAGMALLAVFTRNQSNNKEMAFETGPQAIEEKLADGSEVQLEKNSSMTLLAGYNGKERRIKLQGEATFKVTHDETKPFVIEAGGIFIEDKGTVFHVRAHAASDTLEVSVTEGQVDMYLDNQRISLTAGQSGWYIHAQGKLIEKQRALQEQAAQTFQFHFDNSTLDEVVKELNAKYPKQVQLGNQLLARCRITVDFNGESEEVVLAVIAETLGLTVEDTGSGYLISGSSCTQ